MYAYGSRRALPKLFCFNRPLACPYFAPAAVSSSPSFGLWHLLFDGEHQSCGGEGKVGRWCNVNRLRTRGRKGGREGGRGRRHHRHISGYLLIGTSSYTSLYLLQPTSIWWVSYSLRCLVIGGKRMETNKVSLACYPSFRTFLSSATAIHCRGSDDAKRSFPLSAAAVNSPSSSLFSDLQQLIFFNTAKKSLGSSSSSSSSALRAVTALQPTSSDEELLYCYCITTQRATLQSSPAELAAIPPLPALCRLLWLF